MKIVVLIAGVHDPKWPITSVGGQLPKADVDRQIMSPFDEAALETALRVRDANPEAMLHIFVSSPKIARAVAAFNLADVSTVEFDRPWDQTGVASKLAQLCDGADLILIGREFGDFDDGLIPPMLAAKLGVGFFGRAQVIEAKNGLRVMREAGGFEERHTVSGPLVVSVTNDRRTRLRKPLMKNVMMARQATIGSVAVSPVLASCLQLLGASERTSSRAATTCEMIQGTSEQQTQALVSLLLAARA